MSKPVIGRGASAIVHKSIEALLAEYPGEGSAENIIRRLAREKVAQAKSRGWTGPPYCPKELASLFGIRCKEVSHEIQGEGQILLCPTKKLRIEYRNGRLAERQRFTIFHEFAHTLFPDYCAFIPQHHSAQKGLPNPEKKFENLCDLAASEMLLPLDDARADLALIQRTCFEEFVRLSRRYEASIDATAHRFTELIDTVPCVTVFLTDQKGSHVGRGPLWVKYCCRNALFNGFLPAGVIPPANSVALQCYLNGKKITHAVKETWWLKGNPRTWLVQAIKLPEIPDNPEYSKVAVLLLPSSYKGK